MNTRESLIAAEKLAEELFHTIEDKDLIVAGKSEKQLNEEIFELAYELFGIEKFWHKRIVRAGENTLLPYDENPPNRIIDADDILFFDFGPVFDEWEADFGRTYVLGDDPVKLKIKNDVERIWEEVRQWVSLQNKLTASQLYRHCVEVSTAAGWEFGGPIAGHIVGKFPHERIGANEIELYIHPKNDDLLSMPDANGEPRDWILEIHLVDREIKIGAFFEQLLF
jgi:Xaa-Pro aminopeptidase